MVSINFFAFECHVLEEKDARLFLVVVEVKVVTSQCVIVSFKWSDRRFVHKVNEEAQSNSTSCPNQVWIVETLATEDVVNIPSCWCRVYGLDEEGLSDLPAGLEDHKDENSNPFVDIQVYHGEVETPSDEEVCLSGWSENPGWISVHCEADSR